MIPLIVITGPTASGKTAVALDLAEKYNGEIICADSRTIYKGLDIGTAKPTSAERRRIPHHLLDVARPDEQYNLARFQADARDAIIDIRQRGKVPFLVGGSGLYIDSVVLDYVLGSAPDPARRAMLESLSHDELLGYSNENNIITPENKQNKRYLIRAIEQGGINTTHLSTPDKDTYVFAIKNDNDILKGRINQRAKQIFDGGLELETRDASMRYGWDIAPLRAPAYAAMHQYLDGKVTREQAIAAFARDDWQLARKQMTWLRRHSWVEWRERDDVEPLVARVLTA